MTFGHVFFIPMTIMVGMLLGFVFGSRAARNQLDLERRRDVERAAVRAAREARKADGGKGDPGKPEGKAEGGKGDAGKPEGKADGGKASKATAREDA